MLPQVQAHAVPSRGHTPVTHSPDSLTLRTFGNAHQLSHVISNYCSWMRLSRSLCLEKIFSKAQRRSWAWIVQSLGALCKHRQDKLEELRGSSVDFPWMCWEHWRDEKCVKGHRADLSFRTSSPFDRKINTVWNGNIPFHWCPQRAHLPPWVSQGLGTPSHGLFWRQWLQQVAGEAIVEIWMCFPFGSPPGKDKKILVLSQLPHFFLHPSGSKNLAKYPGNPSQSLWGCVVWESYVSHAHIHAHTQRETPGSRNQPAQNHGGVHSLQPLSPAWLSVITLSGVSTCQAKILQNIPLLAFLLP